jgi:pyridoxamine 5'-phosphate oxidase
LNPVEDLKKYINQLREDFMHGALNEDQAINDPAKQFHLWLQQAVESRITEVQAMSLATVSKTGRPSNRIVYLREFENNDFFFYTNYNSKKALDLEQNPYAAATFFWKELERQVRIEDIIKKASAEQSDAYFNARPYESKLGAWASNQSQRLDSRQTLENKVLEYQNKFTPEQIERPPHWGGFVLTADYYEFWQGRKSRLHDRISYSQKNGEWTMARLAP